MTPDDRDPDLQERIREYARQVVAQNEPMRPEERIRVVALLRTVRLNQGGRNDAA